MMPFDTALLTHTAPRHRAPATIAAKDRVMARRLRALFHAWRHKPAAGQTSLSWPS